MNLLDLKILELYVTRWRGKEAIVTNNGILLLYSRKKQNERKIGGVGMILNKKARKSMTEILDRFLTVRNPFFKKMYCTVLRTDCHNRRS